MKRAYCPLFFFLIAISILPNPVWVEAYDDYRLTLPEFLQQEGRIPGYGDEIWTQWNQGFFAESPDALLKLAVHAFHDQENETLAELFLRQLIARYPDAEQRDQAWYLLGRCYYNQGAFLEAAAAFEKCATATERDAYLFLGQFWAGKSYFAREEHERALQQFETAMRLEQLASADATALIFWIARTYFRLGRYQEASTMFESNILSGMHQNIAPYFYYFSIQSFLGLQDYNKVIRDGTYFLKNFPENALSSEIHYSIALAHFYQQEPDSVIVHTRAALIDYPYFEIDSTGTLVGRPPDEMTTAVSEEIEHWWVDDAYFLHAWMYYRTQQDSMAIEYLSQFNDYFSTSNWRFIALFFTGVLEYNQGNYERAVDVMTTFAERFPRSPLTNAALYRKGWALYQLGRNDDALAVFSSIKERAPSSPLLEELIFSLSELYYYEDHLEEALSNYLVVINAYPNASFYMDALYGAAWCFFREKDYQEAYDYFSLFLDLYRQKFPEDGNSTESNPYARINDIAEYRMGLSLFQLGRYEQAVDSFMQFLSNNINDPFADQAQFYIAEAHFELDDYDNAISSYKQVLDGYPASRTIPKALFGIGNAYFNQGKYRQAIQNFERLEAYDNQILMEEGWYLIERALYQLGVYKNPLDILRNYIRKHPESNKARKLQIELALYYFQSGEYLQAIEEYKNILMKYEDELLQSEAEYMIGLSYFKLKDYSASRTWFKRLLTRDATSNFAAQANYYLGRAYALEEDEMSAFEYYEKVIADFPQSDSAPLALYDLALHYEDLGKLDETSLMLNRLIADYPNSNVICDAKLKAIHIAIKQGQTDDLMRQLASLARTSCPDDYLLEANVTVANHFFDNFFYDDAEALFVEIYTDFSRFEEWRCEALYKAARCAIALKKYNVATTRIQQVLQSECDDSLHRRAEKLLEIITN